VEGVEEPDVTVHVWEEFFGDVYRGPVDDLLRQVVHGRPADTCLVPLLVRGVPDLLE